MSINPTEFPSAESKIFLSGPAGKIEALGTTPTKDARNILALICHPHPLFGGTMHNKVVYTLAKALKDLGVRTLRFNFRGVEKSEGSYAEGNGETEDLIAVLAWARHVRPQDALWLAGFSFGGYVATRVASTHPDVKQLITIAPGVESFDFTQFKTPHCPWLVIQGEKDEIVSPVAVYQMVEQQTPPPHLVRIPNAGHFFHGQLGELRQSLISNLQDRVLI